MISKAIFMLALYVIPYSLLISNWFSPWEMLGLAIIMGIGIAGVGMSVMHDANHGSFSSKGWVNEVFGGTMYLLGGSVYNWKAQHNHLHHTFTNILHVDEDITGKPFLRLSYQDRLKKMHRYQHWYAFILYGLMTFSFFAKDFRVIFQAIRPAKDAEQQYPKAELVKLLISKMVYFIVICLIPLLYTDLVFWQWLVGFVVMHFTAGIILSTIFQLAHVVEGVSQPAPDEQGNIYNAWAIHQMHTTANFSGNQLLSWYIGGLDYQVEHHLFPNISHVHYRSISKIVQRTAEEFGIPYNSKPSFIHAVGSHIRMLRSMGRTTETELVLVQQP